MNNPENKIQNENKEPAQSKSISLYVFSLGNPGAEYQHTRHNAGRIVCDEMLSKNIFENISHYAKASQDKKINNTSNINLTIKYFEPTTFMNNTGKYIRDKMRNAKEGSIVVIIYDDIDLELAEVKLSHGRSSGGHNGVQSVIDVLGTKDFYRVRIGVGGKPIKEMLLQDYVLSKLKQSEINLLKESVEKVMEKILEIAKK